MPDHAPAGVLRGAVDQALATLVEIVQTRLELASVELEEERLRLAQAALLSACALFFGFAALTALAVAGILLCPPDTRPLALALAAVFAAAIAGLAAWRWRRLHATRPPLLQATLDELRADAAALRGESR